MIGQVMVGEITLAEIVEGADTTCGHYEHKLRTDRDQIFNGAIDLSRLLESQTCTHNAASVTSRCRRTSAGGVAKVVIDSLQPGFVENLFTSPDLVHLTAEVIAAISRYEGCAVDVNRLIDLGHRSGALFVDSMSLTKPARTRQVFLRASLLAAKPDGGPWRVKWPLCVCLAEARALASGEIGEPPGKLPGWINPEDDYPATNAAIAEVVARHRLGLPREG